MQDPKTERPVGQQELPKKDEPANDRPVGGKGSSRTNGVKSSLQIRTAHCGANSKASQYARNSRAMERRSNTC